MKSAFESLLPSDESQSCELRDNGYNSLDAKTETSSIKFRSSSRRKKICLTSVLVLAVVAALVIGLVIGLRSSSSDDDQSSASTEKGAKYRPLLLVSLDGFRAGYLEYNVTPHLRRLVEGGVHTPRMLPAYPTLTFPNHYTIVTGLYAESHGIVGNLMFDPALGRFFILGAPEAAKPEWYGGEPIWQTVQRYDKKSACYFWVGADVPINGKYPDIYRHFNKSVPFEERVDTVLDWLSLPADQRPDLVTLYFSEPDHTGHLKGPAPGQEMLAVLRHMDDVIGRLVKGLQDKGLFDDVNLILISDHGMASRGCDRQVKLKDTFSQTELDSIQVYNGAAGRLGNTYRHSDGNITLFDPPKLTTTDVIDRLSGHPHMAVYDKTHLPARLHYANNDRIDPVVLKMEEEWSVSKYGSTGKYCEGGTHGWDSRYESMSAFFVAHGPAFKTGVEVPPFENIELYNLMAHLVGVPASPNNGTEGSLYDLLKEPPSPNTPSSSAGQTTPCRQSSGIPADSVQTQCKCSSPQPTEASTEPQITSPLHPQMSSMASTVCLQGSGRTTLYSTSLHMPLATSFVVSTPEDVTQDWDGCLLPDVDLPGEEKDVYTAYTNHTLGLAPAQLFSSSSGCGNVTRSSDVLPMSQSLKDGVWRAVWTMVRNVTSLYTIPVAVTVGPAFDYNYDGRADGVGDLQRFVDGAGRVPLPSHYFVVLGRCSIPDLELSKCAQDLDLLSFLLPNEQNANAQSAERRLLENVARLRDVELIAGLTFLSDLDLEVSARLRTHVPMSLWTRSGSWRDDLTSQCTHGYKPLLLISLDGFRADYLVKYNRTPTIDSLIRHGVHAPYMRSVYPTKTFPNHYSIVTGLFPESHGIIDNNMYDLNLLQKFCIGCPGSFNPAWWQGEPIWLTAKRHGGKSATFFWPGSDVPIQGERPNYYRNYSGSVTSASKVQTVLQWLRLPVDKRPDFLTLYFDEPDSTGHAVGPNSTKIGDKLAEVDEAIGSLLQGLYHQNMDRCVNIIIIADHGMTGVSCDRLVPLSADISHDDLRKVTVYEGPVGRISNRYTYGKDNNYPADPPKISIDTVVNKLECSEPHMRVYTKATLPLRHHYTNNQRIDDIVLDSDDQWLVSRSGYKSSSCTGGTHGYDDLYASMHALFVAHGPAFKSGIEVEPFENIELYNLMTGILGIPPAPNNGTEGRLLGVLVKPYAVANVTSPPSPTCGPDTDTSVLQQQTCNCVVPPGQAASAWQSPLGEPVSGSDGPSVCVTHRADHSLAFNDHMPGPAWIAFTVKQNTTVNTTGTAAPCVVRDPWLSDTSVLTTLSLQGSGYVPASLLFGQRQTDPSNQCNVTMASEIVPMLPEFKSGVWREVQQLVADYSTRYGDISVTVGPVYDHRHTSLWQGRTDKTRLAGGSLPVPTHVFVVLGRCKDRGQSLPCWESLDLLSFLIPHVATPSNCQTFPAMLRQNVARVRDVELATGLRFFPDLPVSRSAALRTFLPTALWEGGELATPTPKPGHWTDQPCPPRNSADLQCSSDYKPVLLVSLDGFKPQYLGRGLTPVIDRLVSCGVHAPYMRSVYPTKTFPNHYSIATGLYPESHGIIDNSMFDFNISNEKYTLYSDIKNDLRWWGGEPIWMTAKKQNVTSASFFWVGSDVPGLQPDRFKYYSGSVSYSSRVATILEWMALPRQQRPELLTLYFDEPDHEAHASGTFTPKVDAQIRRVDGVLGQLMDGLYQRDLHHCVNLVLVSDHGFANRSCDKVVQLYDYFNETERDNLYFFTSAFGRISNTYKRQPRNTALAFQGEPPLSIRDVQEHLRCVDHLKVYAKTDLPKRHHFVHNHRIDNVILDPELTWTVAKQINKGSCGGGTHGWDNTYRAMEALFVGYGPAFKNGEIVKPFENIELYNLIADLLDIQPASNNGTVGSLDHLLWKTFNRSRQAVAVYRRPSVSSLTVTPVCSCTPGQSVQSVQQALSSQNEAAVEQQSLPWGAPLLMTSDTNDVTLMTQPTSVAAFSPARHSPLWVSATVTSSGMRSSIPPSPCALEDTRLPNKTRCDVIQQYPANVSLVSLLPLYFDLGVTASFVYQQIPMHNSFYKSIWEPLQSRLANWTLGYSDLNVMAGPVFDVDSDGLADHPAERNGATIPTHVFVIAARCNDSSKPLARCGAMQTLAFILPQKDTSKEFNCQTVSEYLVDNEARVRDVELLTGLEFFPDLPFTQAVSMRTYLPSGLWTS